MEMISNEDKRFHIKEFATPSQIRTGDKFVSDAYPPKREYRITSILGDQVFAKPIESHTTEG